MQDHDNVPLEDFIEYSPVEMLERAEHFRDEMRRRHSIRHFSDRPVDQAIIDACIEAGALAPNGANHQPWHFAAIASGEIKAKVRAAAEAEERAFYSGKASGDWLDALEPLGTDADKPYLESAPWLIAIFAQRRGGLKEGDDKKNYYISESVGIATGILITALHMSGLATLTHTPNPMTFLNNVCGRPKDEKPFLLLVAGYPAEGATVPTHALKKKSLGMIRTVL